MKLLQWLDDAAANIMGCDQQYDTRPTEMIDGMTREEKGREWIRAATKELYLRYSLLPITGLAELGGLYFRDRVQITKLEYYQAECERLLCEKATKDGTKLQKKGLTK